MNAERFNLETNDQCLFLMPSLILQTGVSRQGHFEILNISASVSMQKIVQFQFSRVLVTQFFVLNNQITF